MNYCKKFKDHNSLKNELNFKLKVLKNMFILFWNLVHNSVLCELILQFFKIYNQS